MRIALLDCYLQKGQPELAEVESAARLVETCRRVGIEAAVFARSEDILAFAPDFVIALSYHDPKLTPFPTYGLMTAPVGWVEGLPRFRRNILSYDGYWTMAPRTARFVEALCAKVGKPVVQADCTISPAKTEFVPRDLSGAWAAYIGANWDGPRHGDVFRVLARFGVAKFHGKRERWSYLPADAFGGEVSFDGTAALATYRNAGIGLCLNHPDFDVEGLSSNRMFEIPAASAVIIAGRNKAIVEAFGDAALYVDMGGVDAAAAEQIRDHVQWVRSNPKQALERAEFCHSIFNVRFSMEAMLARGLSAHREARRHLGFEGPKAAAPTSEAPGPDIDLTLLVFVRDRTLSRLERCLDSIRAQTLPPRQVIVMDGTKAGLPAQADGNFAKTSWMAARTSSGDGLARLVRDAAKHVSSAWLGCISAEDELYQNHIFAIARALRPHGPRNAAPPALVYSGMSQISGSGPLTELMQDDYQVPRSERMRLVQFPLAAVADAFPHPSSCVMNMDRLRSWLRSRALLRPLPFAERNPVRDLAKEGPTAFTGMVTLATHGAVRRAERLPGMR